jgi:hypothetical protein
VFPRLCAPFLFLVALAGCSIPASRHLNENTFEIYRTTTGFDEVVARLKPLIGKTGIGEKGWLAWMGRARSCVVSPDSNANRFIIFCGIPPLLMDIGPDPRDPYSAYLKTLVVERQPTGAEVRVTRTVEHIGGRYHPNTEIWPKAGFEAEFVGVSGPGR